jgi:hypothetical protein
MSNFCNPSCFVDLTQFSTIDICNLAEAMRSGEIVKLIFIGCQVEVTDITDESEIGGYKTANTLIPSFPGRAKIDEKTTEGVVRIGCQDVSTIGKYPFEFESEIVDKNTGSEWQLYNDINNNKLNLTIAFLTCDGWLLVNPRYSSPGKIGLAIDSLNISPIYDGVANGKMKYTIKGTLSEQEILRPIKLTDAVLALL